VTDQSVREQARAWANEVQEKWADGPSSFTNHLAEQVEPLLAAKAEAEKRYEALKTECDLDHPPEPEYLAWDHERKAWQVADALAEALKANEWGGQTWDSPGDGMLVAACPDCQNEERAGHDAECQLRAALALHSEAKR
jgi:hypothetical protein